MYVSQIFLKYKYLIISIERFPGFEIYLNNLQGGKLVQHFY
jgi:hypothetical protein